MSTPLSILKNYIREQALDAVILRSRANFSWLTRGKHNHIEQYNPLGISDFILSEDRVICVTSKPEARRLADEELFDFPCEIVSIDWTESIEDKLSDMVAGYRKVGADVDFRNTINISSGISQLRRTLTAEQVEQYRETCRVAAMVMEETAKTLRRGQTEREAAGQLAARAVQKGLNPNVILVASDYRVTQYRHPLPTSKPIDQIVMLVMCAEMYGLYANLTRFVSFQPLSNTQRQLHKQCAYIDAVMGAATRPGNTVGSVVSRAMEAYREVGRPDDWKYLHLGGPTGYGTREYLATEQSVDVVRPNQVYTWNPTLPGMKSEDTILVGEHANEYLTETGSWTYLEVTVGNQTIRRPEIFVIR